MPRITHSLHNVTKASPPIKQSVPDKLFFSTTVLPLILAGLKSPVLTQQHRHTCPVSKGLYSLAEPQEASVVFCRESWHYLLFIVLWKEFKSWGQQKGCSLEGRKCYLSYGVCNWEGSVSQRANIPLPYPSCQRMWMALLIRVFHLKWQTSEARAIWGQLKCKKVYWETRGRIRVWRIRRWDWRCLAAETPLFW